MSTRRTTRATSKAASSRGASPAITESDIPPPTPSGRRTATRRAGSAAPLPAIASKASTAYGTNTTIQPASLKVPEQGEEITTALATILQPRPSLPAVREEDTPSDVDHSRGGRASTTRGHGGTRGGRQAASITPAPDRSFDNESRIFGQAGMESSVVSSSEIGGIPGTPATPIVRPFETQKQERERLEREEILRGHARTPVAPRARVQNTTIAPTESFSQMMYQLGDKALDGVAYLIKLFRRLWAFTKTPLGVVLSSVAFAILLSLLLVSSGSYRYYGLTDIKHNFGQFIPDSVAHPGSNFSPNEIKDLQSRLKAAEYDIAFLKKRKDLDPETISHLKKLLPDQMVVKKGKDGNLEVTQEFWRALDAKIRAENDYFQPRVTGKPSKDSSTTDISVGQIESIMEKSKIWDRFLYNNRAQLNAWTGEEFDSRFPDKLKEAVSEGVVASKAEFIDLIRQNWDDTQKEIRAEVRKIAKQMEGTIRNAGQAEHDAVDHTKEEIKTIATDVFKSLFSNAQLQGLSKANQNINAVAGLNRLNHFSQGTGAVVNPKLTSPNYLFPSMNRNAAIKILSWALFKPIPSPNPPEVALQKWEEHGDCWCSPSKDANGFGPSLAVLMTNEIYPDQIIVEHVPSVGSLEPGATPKDMEILAYIEDREVYHAVKRRSDDIFQEEAMEDEPQPYGFVRIGTWTYDSNALSNIQSFPLQIDLSTFKGASHTNRLIVRSKNNWGGDTVDFTCLYRVRVNGEIAPAESS